MLYPRIPFFFFQTLILLSGIIFLTNSNISGQTEINKYAAVLSYEPCNNSLAVDSTNDFQTGDTVLLIQMNGAAFDSSNTINFGNIINYQSAGNYEYNVVKVVSGNSIHLKYELSRVYEIPYGKVQLVKVPSFVNYTVSQPHTCMPWNGIKGGVFAIYIHNSLTLDENISVNYRGFKGGINNQNPTVVGPTLCIPNYNYFMSPNYDSGSMKGEGIVDISLNKSYGRGKLANGGGGGNMLNAGGGGGGNGGVGGRGGSEFDGCNNNPLNNNTGGVGGTTLLYSNSTNKIFMGGGGGSGQANNLTLSNGGNGGGICLITAASIVGNNRSITANGQNALQCVYNGQFGSCHDGCAGGGAAGNVVLNVDNVIGSLHVEAKGGKGADEVGNQVYGHVGPGGGGGGGLVWVKSATLPTNINTNLVGGLNGVVQYNNSSWGAQAGQAGLPATNLILNFPVDTFVNTSMSAGFSMNRENCYTFNFTDQSTSSTPIVTWQWDFSTGTTSSVQNPVYSFPGYGNYTVTLIITDANGCANSVTRNVLIAHEPFVNAGTDQTGCKGSLVHLQASGGQTYSWEPPVGLSNPSGATTNAVLNGTTNYIVTATNEIGCIDKDTVTITASNGPDVAITSDGNNVSCDENTIQLIASGALSFMWTPGIYCSDSTVANPLVTPVNTTLFTVTGTDAHGCSNSDTITITVYRGDAKIFMPNAFSPNNDGKNDEIKPIILCDFELKQFSIYNRWGQWVFVTQKIGKGWDGSLNGRLADVGIYFYHISGKRADGSELVLKGDISLMR